MTRNEFYLFSLGCYINTTPKTQPINRALAEAYCAGSMLAWDWAKNERDEDLDNPPPPTSFEPRDLTSGTDHDTASYLKRKLGEL